MSDKLQKVLKDKWHVGNLLPTVLEFQINGVGYKLELKDIKVIKNEVILRYKV